MINKIRSNRNNSYSGQNGKFFSLDKVSVKDKEKLPEILFITTYPPRECGIATYSQDLILALKNKFKNTFDVKIAALEMQKSTYSYTDEVTYFLETDNKISYTKLANTINVNHSLELVLIQHEFGLFKTNEADFILFLKAINKPIIIVFHTVLPNPDMQLKKNIAEMNAIVDSFIVMTHASAKLLEQDYGILKNKITVIPHGTHLVKYIDKEALKEKYKLSGRKIISTFGLLSSGKSIETSLDAMPVIINKNPDILFLIIGKTHPSVVKEEGEKYRQSLEQKIEILGLQHHVKFINTYLPLEELLDYLQLTDIYLFTSKDPNQAVSGTFSYAISCGCPVISTPIPHASELLMSGGGTIIDFGNSVQLEKKVAILLDNPKLCKEISNNGIHKMAPTAWENSAIAHTKLFEKFLQKKLKLNYRTPKINLSHFKALTSPFAMIQFSIINQPDLKSGYTLDDNARALVAMCQHFELTNDSEDLIYIDKYYHFIHFCQQKDGTFLNYVNEQKKFTDQNSENLEDSNGRAIWALGFMISMSNLLPKTLILEARKTMQSALANTHKMHSTRAMAFTIKGIYYANKKEMCFENKALIKLLANRLVQMYKHESKPGWHWFESYMTYGNSILPEAILCAYLATGEVIYKGIAKTSFDFLLSKTITENSIKVISNKGWLHNNKAVHKEVIGGEQPIDVAYTILALAKFNDTFKNNAYLQKMEMAFSWFLGNNHLQQIIYNPCTGGCYDGLEEDYINLNQGAESTVSYLMARLTVEKCRREIQYNTTNTLHSHNHSLTVAN
ncbi:glycosyltransferase [Flavobacterium sp. GSP14]|uniref:glycosyltransferase n=1 Tax=Flavobacterium sp. GSP14 TaxID=3401734 RepID=UPI003AABF9CE